MSMQVLIKHEGEELLALAEGEMRYLVAANGFFVERRTAIYATACRVDRCPLGLAEHEESLVLKCGRIPEVMSRSMLGFFRAAFDLHGGEAVLLLLYNPVRRTFRWLCPKQTVQVFETWSGVWYPSTEIEYEEPLELPPGYVLLGDAHSHAEMQAYASVTDKEQERYKDGLHIVVGRVHKSDVDLHVDFVMDDRRFHLKPQDVLVALDIRPFRQVPRAWLEQVQIRKHPYGYKEESYWKRSRSEKYSQW